MREAMRAADVDALLLSLGADLPWLSGYVAMPLERLTMLVVPAYGERAVLVVPTLEAPRVVPVPDVFEVKPWGETEDPVEIVSGLVGKLAPSAPVLGISDRAWSSALLKLQASLPQADWVAASGVTAPLRAVKDAWELEALARASAAADRVAAALIAGEVKLIGRTEQDVSAELARRLHAEGHERVEFAIVGSGPNSASPHHEPGARKIGPGEAVVCDFGGSVDGYCSDITRTVFTGPPPRRLERIYTVVAEAQAAGVRAVRPGVPCSDVDAAARDVITDAGFGEHFIHRTGHGIGIEGHEDPYIVSNNSLPLSPGHVFSVEPGVYVPGHYGVRIEDIVAATEDGPSVLNQASRALTVVDV
ncbi:MAG TPA: aminopeptidase P family protein [Acidimicrobiales bacterium]|nr:aminopeptidase P family protein [Acidimicrobiales bacterium]